MEASAERVLCAYCFIQCFHPTPLALHWLVLALVHMYTHFTPGELLLAAVGGVGARYDGKITGLQMILKETCDLLQLTY